jgi:uncharacterized 2Fe-2S/4Fe-4S cluster protein (DUF4445 family)
MKNIKKIKQDKPWIKKIGIEITAPSLKDNTADVDRLIRGIKKGLATDDIGVEFSMVRQIPGLLREYNYRGEAVVFEDRNCWHLIEILPFENFSGVYALAVDLGTSTVVLRLMNLSTMETVDETSFRNPQNQHGADILTRIHFAAQEDGLSKLQSLLIDKINEEIGVFAKTHGIEKNALVGMCVAGNTTMTHLFLGLDPYWICREPYIPVINRPAIVLSSEIGLTLSPRAPILVFPNVGSYFGGDLVAGILASGMMQQKDVSFLVDVGTNAEVVIGNRDWLMACAGAAGPALEGGVASMGMMAGPGVIDRVTIDSETLKIRIGTIKDIPPVGICGSGLIDLVAQLFLSGMIDLRGKYVEAKCGERLQDIGGIKHLVVVSSEDSGIDEPLTLSQPDIDSLMRSKAAMYTILTTISNTVNIPMKEISRFYIAGTFGSYIQPESAITIGMMPDLPLDTYVSLGNSSLEGASKALLSARARDDIFRIRDRITYLELNVNQEFMNLFSAAKFIPHTDRSLFPSVKTGLS